MTLYFNHEKNEISENQSKEELGERGQMRHRIRKKKSTDSVGEAVRDGGRRHRLGGKEGS